MKEKIKCPQCSMEDSEIYMVYEDASFTHPFGTEINRYYYCELCDHTIDAGEVECREKEYEPYH